MKLTDSRNIVLAQAFEETDNGNQLISDEEKRLADAAGGAPLPRSVNQAGQNDFLAKRAEKLIEKIEPRLKGNSSWLKGSPFRAKFGLFALITLVIAIVVGYFSNELDDFDDKINLLKFPLIGILAWSLLVYLGELLLLFRKNGALSSLAGIVTRGMFPPPVHLEKQKSESNAEFRARSLFQSRWRQLNLAPLAARVKATLHFTALLLAAAAVLGMYEKGLTKEYKAAWESTFFRTGQQLEPFLRTILQPAASLMGDELPDGEYLESLKLPESQGENAARWIHWYALTVGLFVVAPRFLLGVIWMFRASLADKRLPFRSISPEYYDRILSISTGDSLGIAIVPYAHKPGETVVQGIRTFMERTFKRSVSITWQDAIAFGEEDEAEVELDESTQPMLLFNFASTPEKETHLALYQQLSEGLSENARPYQIVLDSETFDRKADAFNDADERRATRLSAWKKLFAAEKCEIHVISDHEIHAQEEQQNDA